MIEELKSWIITICTTVIFSTAVEMILPNNNFKKYVKFVLGLILITVLINPIIKIVDKNYNIDNYTKEVFEYFDDGSYSENIKEYKEEGMKKTLNNFKLNLENECQNKLKEKFPNNNYKVEVFVDYDEEVSSVIVKNVKVDIINKGISKVKKVDISTKSNLDSNKSEDTNSKLIKDYLSKELKISNNFIEIYEKN
ncbi:stage III sporulation protein AF [Clostridium sp. USBA 49]|jgi:stage III sporulation protein AF|uniref:stage III sporulation protein AF n=1 Tax=Clostridium TaxID=1485 RepID=UPI00099AE790|nr:MULTISPECIES: stage III sporulation protein AF [Clostridium]SKA76806.1 stage III sporulation protein AF [Clostridium sp. USBA 49]